MGWHITYSVFGQVFSEKKMYWKLWKCIRNCENLNVCERGCEVGEKTFVKNFSMKTCPHARE